MTERRDIPTLLENITSTTGITSKAIAHSHKYEAVAVECFEKSCGFNTYGCGLFVSFSKPMFAATPDRIIDSETLVEVKCPFSSRDKLISETTVPYLYRSNDGKLYLKENHDYFYQVQGQLFCTQRKLCKFVIYTFKGIEVIYIKCDEVFISKMLEKLDSFYLSHFKKAILEKYLYRNFAKYNFTS